MTGHERSAAVVLVCCAINAGTSAVLIGMLRLSGGAVGTPDVSGRPECGDGDPSMATFESVAGCARHLPNPSPEGTSVVTALERVM